MIHNLGVALFGIVMVGCSATVTPTPEPTAEPTTGEATDAPPLVIEGRGIEGLAEYGQAHLDEFGGLYVDPPGGQHAVMLFTANLAEHEQVVQSIYPNTSVREVEHSEAELTALLESIDHEALLADGIEMLSAGVDVIGNRVTLDAKSNDPTAELRLELAYGGLVAVTIHPFPGAWHHVAEGEGWRLIGAGLGTMEAYTVDAATNASAYRRLWRATGLEGGAPDVRLADEVVVAFGHGISLSCPEVRLDGAEIGGETVWSVTSDPLQPRYCTADLSGTHVFVVAVDRAALPDGGFTLWLNEYAADRGGDFSAPLEVELP